MTAGSLLIPCCTKVSFLLFDNENKPFWLDYSIHNIAVSAGDEPASWLLLSFTGTCKKLPYYKPFKKGLVIVTVFPAWTTTENIRKKISRGRGLRERMTQARWKSRRGIWCFWQLGATGVTILNYIFVQQVPIVTRNTELSRQAGYISIPNQGCNETNRRSGLYVRKSNIIC